MMNEAPERIGLISDGLGMYALATTDEREVAIHYIRADHALAIVAAEREACAGIASSPFVGASEVWGLIRARTDTDAQAALEARDKRVREKALRDGFIAGAMAVQQEWVTVGDDAPRSADFSEAADDYARATIEKDQADG